MLEARLETHVGLVRRASRRCRARRDRAPRTPATSRASARRRTACTPLTRSNHAETSFSWCHVSPFHRRTPKPPTTRTAPFGWRCTTTASSDSAKHDEVALRIRQVDRRPPTPRRRRGAAPASSTARRRSVGRRRRRCRRPAGSRPRARCGPPTSRGVDAGRDDRPVARHPAFVHGRSQGVIDLDQRQRMPRRRSVEVEADLRQLLAEPAQLLRGRGSHETHVPRLRTPSAFGAWRAHRSGLLSPGGADGPIRPRSRRMSDVIADPAPLGLPAVTLLRFRCPGWTDPGALTPDSRHAPESIRGAPDPH